MAEEKKTDTKKEAPSKSDFSLGDEVTKIEKKIMALPIDRRMIFFVGLAILIMAFLGDFGKVLLALIGAGMIYIGFSGDNFLEKLFKKKKK